MNPFLYPNVGALWVAAQMQAALAASKLGLFQSGTITLQASTTLADITAVEADYTGYVAGGQTITTWTDPLLNPAGGASIESGLFQFAIASPYTVPNSIQGWFITETGGELVCAGDFPQPKAMVGAGDGIPFNVELIFAG